MADELPSSSWKFAQCFGDKSDTVEVADADIISTVEFDHTGDYLASGDRAGRVVLFQRNQTSHEAEFDYLKSLEINERINRIAWLRRASDAQQMLTCNDKTIKLWRVKERTVQAVYENNGSTVNAKSLMLPRVVNRESVVAAVPRRQYGNNHAYHIHSLSMNADGELFLSADDLRINIWDLNHAEQSFNIVDLKPPSIEELTEVITTCHFHPIHGHTFLYGTSKGSVRIGDMREAALCDRHSKQYRPDLSGNVAAAAFFSEVVQSVSDVKWSRDGRFFATRDYLNVRIWDPLMESRPLHTIPVHDLIKPKLVDLYENDAIFDKFEVGWSHHGQGVLTGSYSNLIRATSTSNADLRHDCIQADKSIFRSKRSSKSKLSTGSVAASSSSSSIILPSPLNNLPKSSGSACRLDEMSVGEMDFERKILHLTMHPREETVAIAALSNLFIFTQQ